MLQTAATACTPTPGADDMGSPTTPLRARSAVWAGPVGAGMRGLTESPALTDAARAWITYLGWLGLARLGMEMGWSWWGGLWAVALWWAWQGVPVSRPSAGRALAAAMLTAAALIGVSAGGRDWLGGLAAGVAILTWAELARQCPDAVPMTEGRGAAAGVSQLLVRLVLFAAAAGLATAGPGQAWPWGVMALSLVLATGISTARLRRRHTPASPGRPSPSMACSHPTMALMMGTWLTMGQWCVEAGLPLLPALTLHAAAMLGGAALIQRRWHGTTLPPRALPATLLIGSALLISASPHWAVMTLAAGLLAAGAAALQQIDLAQRTCARCGPSVPTLLATHGIGAIALLTAGHALPTLGPEALVTAWWLTLLAGAGLRLLFRQTTP